MVENALHTLGGYSNLPVIGMRYHVEHLRYVRIATHASESYQFVLLGICSNVVSTYL